MNKRIRKKKLKMFLRDKGLDDRYYHYKPCEDDPRIRYLPLENSFLFELEKTIVKGMKNHERAKV